MPVMLTVSQVRDALYFGERAQAADSPATPMTALLGQWFHEGLQLLVGTSARPGLTARLADFDADLDLWKAALASGIYEEFVGPRLTQQQSSLQQLGPQVHAFWLAMQAASEWVAELAWSVRSLRPSRARDLIAPWQTMADWVKTEEPLTCELRESGWTDSVRLVGVADAVIRLTSSGSWCALEFKTGTRSPAADLGQACLYHLILSSVCRDSPAPPSALALISFSPERVERLFNAVELASAKQRLIELIGRLAGVIPEEVVSRKKTSSAEGAAPFTPEVTTDNHFRLGQAIVTTLAEYRVNVVLSEPIIAGPTFIRFPIALGPGTKVQAVERHTAELQVRLGLEAEPFVSRDAGQLVIDVQRPDRRTVFFRDVLGQLPEPDARLGGSRLPVGVDLGGRLVCADLAQPEHAHLLIAGTTGSGKSEWLRMAVAGLIVTNTPQTLRLVVIDPKRNAFHSLRESPYLWRPLVFPDEQPASDVLGLLVEEMDKRYRQLDGADSVTELMRRSSCSLPRIVCVCDEYRDLISRSREERKRIEEFICRLGAKARAAGIHLILATQEPSRDTIKGPLDSNIPARVGLKMGKSLESNMLLTEPGAEKLLGHGDLLFKDVGRPRRLQAPLLTEADRAAIFGSAPRQFGSGETPAGVMTTSSM